MPPRTPSAQLVPVTPPKVYAKWWRQVVRDCHCTPAVPFERLSWFSVKGHSFPCIKDDCVGAFVWNDSAGVPPTILLAKWATGDPRIVRHEMLHAVLGGDLTHRNPLWRFYDVKLGP